MQPKLFYDMQDVIGNFNSSLAQLKEEFHKTGRFDDANSKLDEIVKLLAIKYLDSKNGTNFLSVGNLKRISQKDFKTDREIAKSLQVLFLNLSSNKLFLNSDGTNIFGSNPHLNIQSSDNEFAIKVVEIVNGLVLSQGKTGNFDLLNEAFGHFVRDNFRNHKEDAQYMTPQEVVDAMIQIAISDMIKDPSTNKAITSLNKDDFFVLDPTCGVSSFLIYASQRLSKIIEEMNIKDKEEIIKVRNNFSYIGQDKVDRMVRLSKINFLFFGLNPSLISQGNSIVGLSRLNEYIGKVDLILTNPPFGAEFSTRELETDYEKYEILPKITEQIRVNSVNSEILILDRSLRLLKPGGRLLIIVPDSVVSSKGIYEEYRNSLANNYILKAVVDLPSVTFAQAGTRTKCSILYIQKPYDTDKPKQNGIFMAVAKDIGYEVKEKMGTTVKTFIGNNDLTNISDTYNNLPNKSNKLMKVLREKPSIVLCPFDLIINGKWNANFYNSDRIGSVDKYSNLTSQEYEVKLLKEVAEFNTKGRKRIPVSDSVKCISVLHINEDSAIRVEDVMKYKPTCAGLECFPDEIIFAKINPRIPRVAVVPNLGHQLTCSTEFEIIRPLDKKFLYVLKTLLLTELAQKQINSLTSGTSSSHNRIKDSELMNIKLPWPKEGSETAKKLLQLASIIEKEEKNKYKSNDTIKTAFNSIENLVGI